MRTRSNHWFVRWMILLPVFVQVAAGTEVPRRASDKARVRALRQRANAAFGRNFDVRRQASLTEGRARGEGAAAAGPIRPAAEAALRGLAARAGAHLRTSWHVSGIPRSITAERGALAPASGKQPEEIAREFLRENRAVFALAAEDLADFRLAHEIPSGGATHLTFHQTVNGVPVFRGLVQITLDREGRVVHAGAGELLLAAPVETDPRLTPEQALLAAARHFGKKATQPILRLPEAREGRSRFRNPVQARLTPATAQLAVYPLDAKSARLAWRVYLEVGRGRWYETFVDASDGAVLYSQNLYHTAGRARVWKESPIKGPREMVDLPSAWLPAGALVTTGNNADAYLDLWGMNEPTPEDSSVLKGGRAFSSTQLFDFPAGEGSTGLDPAAYKAAAVTNLFYFTNLAHDYFYSLGFNEISGNFQTDNFGRGGLGGDAVRAEAQDPGVFDSFGSFVTPPDGDPPRLEAGIDAGPLDAATDDRDGAYSGQLVFHEYAHGVADRLTGGPQEVSCLLSGEQAMALGEGYADYFALSYFNTPVYERYLGRDQARGLRRYTYEAHPLTFEHLGNEGFEMHNDGEIWAATLWDLRKTLGQSITDRLVVESMRSLPCKPTMVDARDAIVTADRTANAGANRRKLWETFARHGFGYSSGGADGYPGVDFLVFNAAFDLPPDLSSGNRSPAMRSRPSEYAALDAPYSYQVQALDPDGDPLNYELADAPPGMSIEASTGRLSWAAASFTAQRIRVRITDGKGAVLIHGFFLPVLTQVQPGRSVTVAGERGSVGLATVDVPSNTQVLQVTLRGGTGDPDLAVIDPSGELLDMSANAGSAETLSEPAPAGGTWWIFVDGYEAYQNVELKAALPVPEVLASGQTRSGLAGDETSEAFFRVVVPEGASRLIVVTTGGSGDLDLYVRQGKVGTCASFLRCDVDDLSINEGNEESINVADVLPGDWFITVGGFRAYADASLTATVVGPDFTSNAVTNGASFEPTLAPGAIFTIFGQKLASGEASAAATPLPVSLTGTAVSVNGTPAPLYYVSPTQINAQMPFEVRPGAAVILVTAGGLTSAQVSVTVGVSAPGIFQYGTNRAVVQNQDWTLNDSAHPAPEGTVIIAYLTGVTPLDNPVPTGAPAPLSPLSQCTAQYSATIGGRPAEVLYLGLTPNFVGLAQANIRVPLLSAGAFPLEPGDYPLQISVGGVASNGPLVSIAAR